MPGEMHVRVDRGPPVQASTSCMTLGETTPGRFAKCSIVPLIWFRHSIVTMFMGLIFYGLIFTALSIAPASAQEPGGLSRLGSAFLENLRTSQVLMVAIFAGTMSFALMCAFWVIKDRRRVIGKNGELQRDLSSLKARSDRNEALITVSEQRMVVWLASGEEPVLFGSLSPATGAPRQDDHFLNFSAWLSQASLATLQIHLKTLRRDAKTFDMVATTKGGGLLEVQGRTVGDHAFLRFLELSSEREAFARTRNQFAELRSEYNRVRGLVEKLPMPVWSRDMTGQLVWANEAYANALDLPSQEDAVRSNLDLLGEKERAILVQAQQDEGKFEGLLPATVSGDRRKLELFSYVGEDGAATLAVDRSDTETLRALLAGTNGEYARLFDQIGMAVAIFDSHSRMVFHSHALQELWKLDANTLEHGMSNADLLDAIRDSQRLPYRPDWQNWRGKLLQVASALEPTTEKWHTVDGQTLNVVIMPRMEGGATWLFEDVTERMALESSLKAVMRVQGETLDHLDEAVAVFGSDGRLRLSNPALNELWAEAGIEVEKGLHIAKVVEAWTDSLADPSELTPILGRMTGFDEERSDVAGSLNLADDRRLSYGLVALPDGQSMLTFNDVTASFQVETALKERAEALETSDRLKNQFLNHVSYELRVPLTSISGFSEMLATEAFGPLTPKQAEYVNDIFVSAHELGTIFDDLLDLVAMDAGTLKLKPERVDLEAIVEETRQRLTARLQEKSISIEGSVDPNLATMHADPVRLFQIVRHLSANAVEFAPDGSTVHINAILANGACELRVKDNGPGIAAADRGSVFERFETRSMDGSRGGIGLGLSLVRALSRLHGGDVAIEDNGEERGTCFMVSIPIRHESGGQRIAAQ